ncbi:DNA polymerase III subunit epsilon [Vibrio owensii]|uniref:DNA polymerase III subunit epsilon n=1 Tax=Vibrio owensii TaxID=696485 RepID=UPI003CC5DAB7
MDIDKLLNHGRCIVLDTETTGMPAINGHRITEIGAVEVVNRKVTGRTFQAYIDPKREVDEEAEAVHGLSRTDLIRLSDGKVFGDVADDFKHFVNGDPLIIHNAKFDMEFLDMEFNRLGQDPLSKLVNNKVFDTLSYANNKFPGRRNNLDALCKRFGVSNTHRDIHGALVDSLLLADVYLLMTQVQKDIINTNDNGVRARMTMKLNHAPINPDLAKQLKVVQPSATDQERHNEIVKRIKKESGDNSLVPSF